MEEISYLKWSTEKPNEVTINVILLDETISRKELLFRQAEKELLELRMIREYVDVYHLGKQKPNQ